MQPESPENSESVQTVGNDALSTRSCNIYESTYQRFMKWCGNKEITNYTESVLLKYFSYLTMEIKMKGATMWAHYSMLKSTLNTNHGVDTSKYLKLRAYLKMQNKNHVRKKSGVFTKEQYERFLSEAPDEKYLGMKVNFTHHINRYKF